VGSTYNNNPASTPKDGIRFLINDTASPFQFTDEEVLFALNTQANIWMAAALLSDKLTTIVSSGGLASKSIGSLSESYSQGSVAFFQQQAKEFRMMGRGHQVPWCEAISQKFSFRQFDIAGVSGPMIREDRLPTPFISEEEQ
jgi:hypothetical protein